jgi:uncharacterized protein YycO
MKYQIFSKKLDLVERELMKFVKKVTPEIEKQIKVKEKKARQKFKVDKLPKHKNLDFSIKKEKDFIVFTDPTPQPNIGFLKDRAGKKMASFIEDSLKEKIPDIKVKLIKGD